MGNISLKENGGMCSRGSVRKGRIFHSGLIFHSIKIWRHKLIFNKPVSTLFYLTFVFYIRILLWKCMGEQIHLNFFTTCEKCAFLKVLLISNASASLYYKHNVYFCLKSVNSCHQKFQILILEYFIAFQEDLDFMPFPENLY